MFDREALYDEVELEIEETDKGAYVLPSVVDMTVDSVIDYLKARRREFDEKNNRISVMTVNLIIKDLER